jgi:hypothetical protein
VRPTARICHHHQNVLHFLSSFKQLEICDQTTYLLQMHLVDIFYIYFYFIFGYSEVLLDQYVHLLLSTLSSLNLNILSILASPAPQLTSSYPSLLNSFHPLSHPSSNLFLLYSNPSSTYLPHLPPTLISVSITHHLLPPLFPSPSRSFDLGSARTELSVYIAMAFFSAGACALPMILGFLTDEVSRTVSGALPLRNTLFNSFNPSLLHSFTPSILHSFNPSLLQSFTPSVILSDDKSEHDC